MNRLEDGVWPLLVDDQAPWREPWPDDDLGHADHVTCPLVETLPAAVYRRAALALQDHLDALARGAPLDRDRLAHLADAAAIPRRPGHDRRPVLTAPAPVSEDVVALQALDNVPDAGQRAPHAVLGPWRLALTLPADRLTFVHALAQWAVSGPGRSPIEVWTRSRSAPPATERACLRAIWQAPLGVWRLRSRPDGWHVDDRVGLDARRVPDGPVTVSIDKPVQYGSSVLARAMPTVAGWRLWGGLVLPVDVPDRTLGDLLHIGLIRERLRNRRASVEDVLRDGGRWFAGQVFVAAYRASQDR